MFAAIAIIIYYSIVGLIMYLSLKNAWCFLWPVLPIVYLFKKRQISYEQRLLNFIHKYGGISGNIYVSLHTCEPAESIGELEYKDYPRA